MNQTWDMTQPINIGIHPPSDMSSVLMHLSNCPVFLGDANALGGHHNFCNQKQVDGHHNCPVKQDFTTQNHVSMTMWS